MASWFISPLLSGFMSGVLFVLIRIFILKKVSWTFEKLSFRTNFYSTLLKYIVKGVSGVMAVLYCDSLETQT